MNAPPAAWQSLLPLTEPLLPALFALGAWVAPLRPRGPLVELTAVLGLGLALAGAGGLALSGIGDLVTSAVLSLVCFIAVIITRFSRTYLDGDRAQTRYVRWLLATLAAVTALVVADNLVLMAAAWIATSLTLHQLLTLYSDRPQALVAAHKKFLVSRVADLCLLVAVVLLGLEVGSHQLAEVRAWAAAVDALPARVEVAAVLLVMGAALKSAQLPFHGWLTQVMEAPTPVSALLHAGVINMGGLLMIRLSPLMVKSELAQTLLVVIGASTAVVAALVMTTRISVKVALAWSTCAQMGFMFIQCGLGAYELALLHLVAHSLYKAHAFLSSGSAVDVARVRALSPPAAPPALSIWFTGLPVALLGVAAVGWAFGADPRQEPALWALASVLALAVTALLVSGAGASIWRLARVAASAVGVAALYFGWHALFKEAALLPASAVAAGPTLAQLTFVAAAFGLLFAVTAVVQPRPRGRLAGALHPLLFAGLHLDELFTRVTFRVWPPRMPPQASSPSQPLNVAKTQEA